MKRPDQTVSECLNCGKDTGCPNKLVCDDCRKGSAKKELFFRKYVASGSSLLEMAGSVEMGPMTSREIDQEVYKV